MDEKLVSVAVAIYKVEKYLDQCISSICSQTHKNIEIILVDDGSPDHCGEICDLWAKKDSRIKVIHKQNGGLVSARKAGLKAAMGEYILYVDGDDWLEPRMIEEMLKVDADVIITGVIRDYWDGSIQIQNVGFEEGLYIEEKLNELKKEMICKSPFYTMGILPNLWNKLFKRNSRFINMQMSVDDKVSIGEDFLVTIPYMLECQSVYVLNNSYYHYRLNRKGMTGSRDPQYLEKTVPLLLGVNGYINVQDEPIKRQLCEYMCHILINGLSIVFDFRTNMKLAEKKAITNRVMSMDFVTNNWNCFELNKIPFPQRELLICAKEGKPLLCTIWSGFSLIYSKLKGMKV